MAPPPRIPPIQCPLNHEGDILRYVFFHCVALACLVGLYGTMQAHVWPFTLMVVH